MIKLRIEGVYSEKIPELATTSNDVVTDTRLPVELVSGIGLEFEYPESQDSKTVEVKISFPIMYNSEKNRFHILSQEQYMAELYSCVGDLGGSIGTFTSTVKMESGIVDTKLRWTIVRGDEYYRSLTHELHFGVVIEAQRKA